MVEQRGEIAQVAEVARYRFAPAITTHVETNHAKTRGKVRELVLPLPVVGHARVNHHERLAIAGGFIVDAGAVDRRESGLAVRHSSALGSSCHSALRFGCTFATASNDSTQSRRV